MTDIPTLIAARKTLTTIPEWTLQNDQFRLVATLDLDGVTLDGIWLRVTAYKAIPDRRVSFQIEFKPEGFRHIPAARVDWRPANPHSNRNIGPAHLRLMVIEGSHHHTFDANWPLGFERMVSENLPIAEPLVPDPRDFEGLLHLVGRLFNVDGMKGIAVPKWEPGLFDR
ncbi:MAG: hypothetical protein HZC25_08050 [Rhodospirillales bacterium]|nr:hypothetical protein [Rhodospirillales bacterium]